MNALEMMAEHRPEDRFRKLFDLIGDPVVEVELLECGPIVRTVNPAFEEVFGYDSERVRGESLNEYIVPEACRDQAAQFDQQTASGTYSTGMVTRLTADGPREFLYRGVPYERNGRRYAFALYTDITEQKQREQELERKNERLDEFASIVSHDLRNPLNVAQLQLDMIERECESEHVEKLASSLNRIETIVEDTLALAREGKTVAETDLIDLSTFVQESWEALVTGEATIEIDTAGKIEGDRERLRQVFENLFRNAMEYGGHDVTVEVGMIDQICASTRCSPAERYEGFYIADDGPGIDPAHRQDVFEPDFTTSGNGFGLSIVQEIVDAHGWSIRATESADGGARFDITGVELSE